MHRHITYYTQSTVCQGGFSNKCLSTCSSSWVYAGFAKGANYFFGGGWACDVWRSHAFARGVRGHASPKNFFLMVQFGAFLEHISINFYFQKV